MSLSAIVCVYKKHQGPLSMLGTVVELGTYRRASCVCQDLSWSGSDGGGRFAMLSRACLARAAAHLGSSVSPILFLGGAVGFGIIVGSGRL